MFSLRLRPDQYLVLALLSLGCILLPQSARHTSTPQVITEYQPLPELNSSFSYALKNQAELRVPDLTAKAYLVLDAQQGSLLVEKNAQTPLPPATMTKLMTTLVSLNLFRPDQSITITPQDLSTGNTMELRVNETLGVQTLLTGLLVYSANDAAEAFANHTAEGREAFIANMNQLTNQIFLKNTSFRNPTGFDQVGHYATAQDIARLALYSFSKPEITNLLQLETVTLTDVTGTISHPLTNTNQLLGSSPDVIFGKTGSTLQAGECLVTLSSRNNHPIITVVMGSQDRFTDTQRLIDWTYDNFTWTPATAASEPPLTNKPASYL